MSKIYINCFIKECTHGILLRSPPSKVRYYHIIMERYSPQRLSLCWSLPLWIIILKTSYCPRFPSWRVLSPPHIVHCVQCNCPDMRRGNCLTDWAGSCNCWQTPPGSPRHTRTCSHRTQTQSPASWRTRPPPGNSPPLGTRTEAACNSLNWSKCLPLRSPCWQFFLDTFSSASWMASSCVYWK